MNILWADLTACAKATVVRRSVTPPERALCERRDGLRRDSRQAAEIAWLTSSLIAGAAREPGNLRCRAHEAGAAKRLRSYGQRGPIQPHHRHARRARDMEWPAIASDIERGLPDERAQL